MITLFGIQIPLYGICFWVAIFLCAVLAVCLCSKRRMKKYDIVYSAVFAMIGAVIGAKLLFLAVSWKEIVENHLSLENVLKGGFVFYGGLLGGALGIWLYARIFSMKVMDFFDVYALVLPLGHAIGRVGCFFAGCCYGIPCDGPLCFAYTSTVGQTPLGVKLLPIQLIEAVGLMVLFIVGLIWYIRHPMKQGAIFDLYLWVYPCLRFVVEFFRGDKERGGMLCLSTSQWISVGLLAVAVIRLFLRCKKRRTPFETHP